MNTLTLEIKPLAQSLELTADSMNVELADGRCLSVPLAWYPRLLHATESERDNWQLLGDGYAIEWPDLDEHIGVEGLLVGRKSGEGDSSLKRWLATRIVAGSTDA